MRNLAFVTRGLRKRWAQVTFHAAAAVLLVACSIDEDGSGEPASEGVSANPGSTSGSAEPTPGGKVSASSGSSAVMRDPIVPEAGNDGYDVAHYQWDLTIDPTRGSLRAHGIIDAVATTDLASVQLDYSGAPLASLQVDGANAEHSYTDSKLVIEAHLAAGSRFEITFDYDGTPERGVAPGRLGRFGWIAQNETVHTEVLLPGDKATILPLNDTPQDPATYALDITVPTGYVATASGHLDGVREQDGSATYSWRVDSPVSEITLAVGEYVIESVPAPPKLDVEISVALSADDLARLDDFGVIPDIIGFFQAGLGPFPYQNLGFTIVDGLGGAGDSTPARIHLAHTGESGLVHELAHQWMGGVVGTASSADSWLREGFPRFMEMLWLDQTGAAELDVLIAASRDLLGDTTRPPLEVTRASQRGDDVTYERGALTFHALYAELGDELFWQSMATFFDDFAGTSAGTDDFIRTVERVSDQQLANLFDAWLRRPELPPTTQSTSAD